MTELRASMDLPPAELAEKVLEVSGYRDALAADTSIESEGRLENLLKWSRRCASTRKRRRRRR